MKIAKMVPFIVLVDLAPPGRIVAEDLDLVSRSIIFLHCFSIVKLLSYHVKFVQISKTSEIYYSSAIWNGIIAYSLFWITLTIHFCTGLSHVIVTHTTFHDKNNLYLIVTFFEPTRIILETIGLFINKLYCTIGSCLGYLKVYVYMHITSTFHI